MNEKCIDYLQYNIPEDSSMRSSRAEPINPIRNYKAGYLQPDGTRVYTGNVMSKKALCILSGETLQNMRVNGISNEDYIRDILSKGATVSRIDLAVTQYITGDLLTPSCFAEFAREGKIISSHAAYGAKYIASVDEQYSDNIETVYIGDIKRRGKKGIVRVYDKGLEMNLDKFLITRVEVEDKRDKAHVSAKRIARGDSIASVLKSRFDVNDLSWQELIDAPSLDMSRGVSIEKLSESTKNVNRWQWLIDKVAPSVAKSLKYDIENDIGTANIDSFYTAIAKNYYKLDSKQDS